MIMDFKDEEMKRFKKYGGVFDCNNELFEMYYKHSGSLSNTYSDLLLVYYKCLTMKHPNNRNVDWLKSEGLKLVDGKFNQKEYENSVEFLHSSLGFTVMTNNKKEYRKVLEQLKTREV